MSNQLNTTILNSTKYHVGFMPDHENFNKIIMDAYLKLFEQDIVKRSHYFGGRHENIYIENTKLPSIERLLLQASNFAANILNVSARNLRSGFWINDMGPGTVTSEHDHDDYDELLSGVYYLQVPENSGDLIISENNSLHKVTPRAGMFIFFAPDLLHSVSENLSCHRRISIGMNFGPC